MKLDAKNVAGEIFSKDFHLINLAWLQGWRHITQVFLLCKPSMGRFFHRGLNGILTPQRMVSTSTFLMLVLMGDARLSPDFLWDD